MDRAPAAVATGLPRVWTSVTQTLLGDATSTWTIDEDGFVFTTDDPFDRSVTFRWADVREAAAATMDLKPGGPDKPSWAASRIDWLVASLVDGTTVTRRLPGGVARDEIAVAVAARLGTRWSGDGLPLTDTQRRFGGASSATTNAWLQLALIIVGFFVLVILSIIVLGILLLPIVTIPAATCAGLWLLDRARAGLRAASTTSGLQVVPIGSAGAGVVRVAGRVAPFAAATTVSRAAISGTPAVWWDVAVYVIGRESNVDDLKQVAGRFGGVIDTVVVEDDSGSVPVWLDGADLVIAKRTWESEKGDMLPPGGHALLTELGLAWSLQQRVRVDEESVDVGSMLTVVGTRSARSALPVAPAGTWSRLRRLAVTGEWRRALVAALPAVLRPTFAVFIGYLDLVGRFGFARERPPIRLETPPPALDPSAPLIWRGLSDGAFVVSNQPIDAALDTLRKRSLLVGALGVGALTFALWQAGSWLFHR